MTDRDVAIGDAQYRIEIVARDNGWLATARRTTSGEPFGPAFLGVTPEEAGDRARTWLAWQHDHQQALEALQDAERAYQRIVAGVLTKAPAGDDPTPAELHQEALAAVEQARRTLDEIRARRPQS